MEILILGVIIIVLINTILILKLNKKNKDSKEVTSVLDDHKTIIMNKLLLIDDEVNKIEKGFVANFETQIKNSNIANQELLNTLHNSQEKSFLSFSVFEKTMIQKFHEETLKNANFTAKQKEDIIAIITEKLNTSTTNFQIMSQKLIEQIESKLQNEIELNAKNKAEILNDIRTSLNQNKKETLENNEKFLLNIENTFKQSQVLMHQTVSDLKKEIAVLSQKQEQLTSLEGTIKDFNSVLTNSKLRGLFGEQQMEMILTNYFGEEGVIWSKQYKLKNGMIPDAVIHCAQPIGELAIDSKFPLDNYRKMVDETITDLERNEYKKAFKNDLKARLKEVSKYVKEKELANQAIMFIPAEAVFIEICSNFEEIMEEGYKNNVWVAGPTTLMATLNTVKMSIEKVKLNENAEKILDSLDKLSIEFERYAKRNEAIEKNLEKFTMEYRDVVITSNKISKEFEKIKTLK